MPNGSRGGPGWDAGTVAEGVTNILGGCLIVTLPRELNRAILQRIRAGILGAASHSPARGLVLDASAVCAVDSRSFAHLAETAEMVGLLGLEAVLVGLQPGVVSTIVDLGIDTRGLRTFRGLDDAVEDLSRRDLGQNPDREPAEEAAPEEAASPAEGDAE